MASLPSIISKSNICWSSLHMRADFRVPSVKHDPVSVQGSVLLGIFVLYGANSCAVYFCVSVLGMKVSKVGL